MTTSSINPKPVLFGDSFRVQGEKASSAAAQLVKETEARGEAACFVTAPFVEPGDSVVLTGQEARTYQEITAKARKQAIFKLGQALPLEIIGTLMGQHKKAGEPHPFKVRVMKRVSDDLVQTSRAQIEALMANSKIVNAADILPEGQAEDAGALIKNVDEASFSAEVEESELPVLIDFWAPWCGPCKAIEPLVEELAEENQGRLKVVKVNLDENPGLADQLNVMSIPALLVFKNGDEVARQIGASGKSKIVKLLSSHLD